MGIFHETVVLVNRTSKPLNVRFDGQDLTLQPGENVVPKIIVEYARRQCVRMGTNTPHDPANFVSLVGVPGKHDVSPIEQDEDAPSRFNMDDEEIPAGHKLQLRGRKKFSVHEATAGVKPAEEDADGFRAQ